MTCISEAIPSIPALEELKQFSQWVVYKGVTPTSELPNPKAPFQPNNRPAKNNDPSTWSSYDACAAAVSSGKFHGLGFVFSEDDQFGGTDFDKVRNPITGETEPWALEEITRLNTYAEVSPSGTGYHCLGRFTLPGPGKNPVHNRAEIYNTGRYFTFTGDHAEGTPTTINDCQKAAESFYTRVETLDPKFPKPILITFDPFTQFKTAIAKRSVEVLLDDEDVSIAVGEGSRHDFLNSVAGYLWDGKRTREELLSLITKIAERFCSAGNRAITEKELGDLVDYCVSREPNQVCGAKIQTPTPSEKMKSDFLSANWFTPGDVFLDEQITPKKVFVTDKGGDSLLTSSSLNEIFAFRGYGKSLFMLALVNILLHGGEVLGFKATGGQKVLLCDGELPPEDLQMRLKKLVGKSAGRLHLMSPHNMPRHVFPPLSDPDYQARFLEQVDALKPDVIVFDTLSACFKFDTNDTDLWIIVNQFFIELRNRGICLIVTHHAGKNGTQRGRTDGDDNMDLIMKLDLPKDHLAGQGLNFILSYEKVRGDSRLTGFQATYSDSEWEIVIELERESIINMVNDGKSYKVIEVDLGVSSKKISAAVKYAKQMGLFKPISKSGKEAK